MIDDDDKRTLLELITLYENEPELRDIYVEGEIDASFVKWFLGSQGLPYTMVYSANDVFVPAGDLANAGLPDGNRGRLILLGRFMLQMIPQCAGQVLCIVDKDWDLVLGDDERNGIIEYTDYSSMEMYAYNIATLQKIFGVIGRRMGLDAQVALNMFTPVLTEMYLLRAANQALKWGLIWGDFFKVCVVSEGAITAQISKFTVSYLATKGKAGRLQEFNECLGSLHGRCHEDARNNIRGHDYVDMIAWYLCENGCSRTKLNIELVERGVFACIESQDLLNYPLFQKLVHRVVMSSGI